MKIWTILLVVSSAVCIAGKKSFTFYNDSEKPLPSVRIEKSRDKVIAFEGKVSAGEHKKIEFDQKKIRIETVFKCVIKSKHKETYISCITVSSLLTQFHWNGTRITVDKPFEYVLSLIEQDWPKFDPEDSAKYDGEWYTHNNFLPKKCHPPRTPFLDQSIYDSEPD